MDKIAINTVEPVKKTFEKYVAPILSNDFVEIIIGWLVIVSIVFTIDKLPTKAKDIINHPVSKTILTFAGLYSATKKFYMSVVITVVLLGVFYGILSVKEHFELVWPQTDTSPNCSDITVKDLLALFDGDAIKLKKVMYSSNIPLNVSLTDLNAPLIATYLVNYGYSVSKTCQAPKDM